MTKQSNPKGVVDPRPYLSAMAIVFTTAVMAFFAHRLIPHASLSLLFLFAVLFVASRSGVGPSLLASVLSFLAFNFFFTIPYYTLKVANDEDVATLLLFLVIAAVTGNLAARMHREIARRKASLQRVSVLYDFSRSLSSATDADVVLNALVSHLKHSVGADVVVVSANQEGSWQVVAQTDDAPEVPLGIVDEAWGYHSIDPVTVDNWTFMQLAASRDRNAFVAIKGALDTEQADTARNFCEQAGLALDRTQLVADLEQAKLVKETEQLRSALLSSVSHDLRTPLASIIGSTTSLLEYRESFNESDRNELLATVAEEAQRLDRHIQNLLDMSRLGQGRLTLSRDWVDVHDIIYSVVEKMGGTLKTVNINIDIEPDVPMLWVHGVLIEQAVVNLLDNAVRFSPREGQISITARHSNTDVVIELCDEGPGIPQEEREKIFDMFYTARQGDRSDRQGTGLGLAICRGMVAAHYGTVSAQDGKFGRGTCMQITLPIIQPDEAANK